MPELSALSPCMGHLPLEIGSVVLREVDLGHLTLLAPRKGSETSLSETLLASHGIALPETGHATGREGARAIWFGLNHVLLAGPSPHPSLKDHAALVDQSDGWCSVCMEGNGIVFVLSRLVPVDLRISAFGVGRAVRTDLGHMSVSLTRIGVRAILVLGFRSMAHSMVRELQTAMESVAIRG